jgi:hypothetical protein
MNGLQRPPWILNPTFGNQPENHKENVMEYFIIASKVPWEIEEKSTEGAESCDTKSAQASLSPARVERK